MRDAWARARGGARRRAGWRLTSQQSLRRRTRPGSTSSRRRGSTSGRTTTAAGRRPTTQAGCTSQKQLGSKVQTTYKENVPEGPQVAQVIDEPRPRRQQDHLRDLVRLPGRDGQRRRRSTRTSSSSRRPARAQPRTWPSTSAPARTRSTSPAWPPARRRKKGVIGYVVPFAIPEVIRHATRSRSARRPRTRARRSSSSGRTPGSTRQGEARRRRASSSAGADVLGQNVDSPAAGQFAESKGVPWVGYDSDAQKFAPKQWLTGRGLQLGPVLPRSASRRR